MRTKEKWNRQKPYLAQKLFSKRLCDDLENIPAPKTFPDLELEKGEGVFLYGPLKTGKTVYAAQLALDIQKRWWMEAAPKNIVFISTPRLFRELKNSFKGGPGILSEDEIMTHYEKADLLLLDDLGMGGKVGEWLIDVLFMLIDYRWEHQKPTIITSNNSLDELAELFGDGRITSRIGRMCRVIKKKPWEG